MAEESISSYGIAYAVGGLISVGLLFRPKTEWMGLYLFLMVYLFATAFMSYEFISMNKENEEIIFSAASYFFTLAIWINITVTFINSLFVVLLAVFLWGRFYKYGYTSRNMTSRILLNKWQRTKALWVFSICLGFLGLGLYSLPKFDVDKLLSSSMGIGIIGIMAASLSTSITTLYYVYTLYKARYRMHPQPKRAPVNKAETRPIRPYDELWGGASISYLSKYLLA